MKINVKIQNFWENINCVILCSQKLPYLYFETNECIKECNEENLLNKLCKTSNHNISIKEYNIDNIRKSITNHSIDKIIEDILNKIKSIIIDDNNIKYEKISSFKNKDDNNNNISTIDLG